MPSATPGLTRCVVLFALILSLPAVGHSARGADDEDWDRQVEAASPAVRWSFTDSLSDDASQLSQVAVAGAPERAAIGPQSPEFPLMPAGNNALLIDGRSWLAIDDPGDDSVLDFATGDTISVEAWVRLSAVADGQQVYVIGKGRTQRPGQSRDNQNWALRVRGGGGLAHVSFLFRSADEAGGPAGEFHRWNSVDGFEPDGLWHHIAVSFCFGSDESPRAWIDGRPSGGRWDMGGEAYDRSPVVDNDQVWIGSSMGGNPGGSLSGAVDEILLFRRSLTDEEIAARFRTTRPSATLTEIVDADVPDGTILCDIREGVDVANPWNRAATRITQQWKQPHAALAALPRKYIRGGLIGDRTNPSVLRLRFRLTTVEHATQLLMRSRSHARLRIDGETVLTLEPARYATNGHGSVRAATPQLHPGMHPVQLGDQEALTAIDLSAGEHLVEFETLLGGSNMRVELNEAVVATGSPEDGFVLLTPTDQTVGLDERSWRAYAAEHRALVADVNAEERRRLDAGIAEFWDRRHGVAAELIADGSPPLTSDDIDRMLESELEAKEIRPLPVVDDVTFLRRLTLSTVGIIPTPAERDWFFDQPPKERRRRAIDRFLADPRWADHQVALWQDVLAENPGILKPKLNNSGPFRWWIHDCFLDNKASDRFATELVMMRGSRLGGGPAGFAMATQNDVPLANRALVLSTAFNARAMTCARCHDSPVRDVSQQQLFEFAAMLNRAPLQLPKSSTVPAGPNGEHSALISVSLKPGAVIPPNWPFSKADAADSSRSEPWASLLQNPADTREQAALHLTHPTASPFAEVIVNRMWARLFGRGLIPDLDDWSYRDDGQAAVLAALARDHIRHGYDFRHTARRILLTRAWQRETAPADSPVAEHFGAQTMRRLSAEQLVDSLYAAVGKSFQTELLTLDPEGRRPISTFINLGRPARAWQFCSLSNERDRPALALPVAQSLVDLLTAFGWRDSRPQPLSARPEESTVLQPLTLANGTAGHRLVQLSEDSAVTALALEADSPEQFVRRLTQRILTREPRSDELQAFGEAVSVGFTDRRVPGATPPEQPPIRRNLISWSNHLNAKATEIKQQMETAAREGDPPTVLLTEDWRTRAEDVVWVLLNSPEFVFLP